jgi:hypothetical protein
VSKKDIVVQPSDAKTLAKTLGTGICCELVKSEGDVPD